MLYLISQVLLLLALASVISGLIGWLLRAFQSDRSEQALKRRLRSSQRAVPSMQRALAAAHSEIDRRENDIQRLSRKIAEIDSDPGNFRAGDFDNLNGTHPEDHAHDLVRERALSGNSQFRESDFNNGIPTSEEHQQHAVEILNSRIEDTDGKYRESDFAGGQPATAAEQQEADKLAALRAESQKYYRDGDFVHGTPRNAEEQAYATHIDVLREEKKAERTAAKEHRRILVSERNKAQDGLAEAKRKAAELQDQLDSKEGIMQENTAAFEEALTAAHYEINRCENDIHHLNHKIAEIDSAPGSFRAGDFDNLNGTHPDDHAHDLVRERALSGNSQFRESDFNNGIPTSEEHQQHAVEILNTRIEDTDGKYRESDFAGGQPATAAEQQEADKLAALRAESKKYYRDGDFVHGTPRNAEEQAYADHIDVLREEKKAERIAAKEHRRVLVLELNKAQDGLEEAKLRAAELQDQVDRNEGIMQENTAAFEEALANSHNMIRHHEDSVNDLESALNEAHDVVEKRDERIEELENQIEEIDTDANHFREGDMENLNGLTPLERSMEIAIERATSGNSRFRNQDFAGQAPLSNEEKKLAVEYLATRDEDTDGKYRESDFVNGVPQNAAEAQRALSFDAMRTVLEKLYRSEDFEGDKPQTKAEIELAARIDGMRAKNKAYRSASKKQRKILKRDLANAKQEQMLAQQAVAELEGRMKGITTTNDNLEDIIASLREDIGSKTALQNQAGKKVDELAATIDKLERELAKATLEGHKKAGDLESELRRVKDQLATAKQEATSTAQSLKAAKATLAERTSDKEKLQAQYAEQKTELALANSQLTERKQEIVKLNAAKDQEIQELKFALKNQEAENQRLEEEMQALKRELQNSSNDRTAQENFEIQKALADVRVKELENALKEHTSNSQTWEGLKKELDALTQSLENKDKDLEDANNQLAQYQELDDELRNRIEVLESMLAEQRLLAGKSMSSRIREIEAMLSAERRKVESMTIESSISDVTAHSAPATKVVTTSRVSKISNKKD